MNFLIYLAITLLISYALRPKAQTPKAEAFEDIDFPRAEEGTPQGVIFGDCWVPDWAVIAVGNYRTVPIVQRSQVTGYWYAFGCHMGIAKAIDELIEIRVGDKPLWRGSLTANGSVRLEAPNLFGGFEREGGISGDFYIFFGGDTQVMPVDGQVTATLTTPSPGFRGRATAFFDGIMCARSPYPKPWKFRVRRITSGWDGAVWYPERAAIEIVRPVSVNETQGETGSTDETATVRSSTPVVITLDVGSGDLRVTLSGLVSLVIEEVWLWDGTQPLTAGLHYVIESGNIIHFADVGENLGGGVNTISFNGKTAICRYTHLLTTVFPSSTGELGTTRIRAMNPAHMLYECYTNRIWGRGYPASALNLSATEGGLEYLANRLFNEGFGLCYRWNRKGGIKSVIQTIIDTIGCNIYSDRATGKISFKLMRNEYDINTLPLFKHDTGLIAVEKTGISSKEQAINEIVIMHRDPVTNNDQPVRHVNTASMQATGGIANTQTIEMLAIPTADLASRVARREMKGRTAALQKYELLLDRRGRNLVPGSLLRCEDLPRNIVDTVLRVASIEYGPLGRGQIKVVAMKDVFGTPTSGFPTMPPPTNVPVGSGRPCFDESVTFELPYRSVKRMMSPGDFSTVGSAVGYLGYILSNGGSFNQTYDIALKNGVVDVELESPPDGGYFCQLPDDPSAIRDLSLAWSAAGAVVKDLPLSYSISNAGTGTYSPLKVLIAMNDGDDATTLTNSGTLGGSFSLAIAGSNDPAQVKAAAAQYGSGGLRIIVPTFIPFPGFNDQWDFSDALLGISEPYTLGFSIALKGIAADSTANLQGLVAITIGVSGSKYRNFVANYSNGKTPEGALNRSVSFTGTGGLTYFSGSWSSDDSWYQFEVGFDGTTTYLFLNGTLIQTVSGNTLQDDSRPACRVKLFASSFVMPWSPDNTSKSVALDQFFFVPGACVHTENFTPGVIS